MILPVHVHTTLDQRAHLVVPAVLRTSAISDILFHLLSDARQKVLDHTTRDLFTTSFKVQVIGTKMPRLCPTL